MRESKDEKKFCRRHRRSRGENLKNSLDEVDLQEKGFLLSPHTAQTDYWFRDAVGGSLARGAGEKSSLYFKAKLPVFTGPLRSRWVECRHIGLRSYQQIRS